MSCHCFRFRRRFDIRLGKVDDLIMIKMDTILYRRNLVSSGSVRAGFKCTTIHPSVSNLGSLVASLERVR